MTFRNDGNAPMTLTGLSGLSSLFSVTGNTCSGIAAGSSCSMTITMPTSAAGSGPNPVSTAGAATNASFSISGAVYSAVSRWSATSLSFGSVLTGTSQTQSVTLFNDGYGAAINWSGVLANLPAGFTANTSACASVAPAGGSCSVGITFSPTAGQAYSGNTIHPANISYPGNTLAVSGTGVVAAPAISGSPSALNFGGLAKGIGKNLTLTVSNTGSAAATGLAYTIGYTSGSVQQGPYLRNGGTCPTAGGSLAAGSSCTVVVRYEAGCTGGTRNGTYTTSGSNFASLVTTMTASTQSSGICP